MIPRAYVGSASDGKIFLLDEGHQDDGQAVDILAQSNPLAPGGADGDCTFDRVFITLTWSMNATLRFTPLVDEVEKTDSTFDIVLTSTPTEARKSKVFERTLREPFKRAGVEKYKKALRGTWFSMKIETIGGIGAGDLILDEILLEHEIVNATKELVS